jgi:hypothetical protein
MFEIAAGWESRRGRGAPPLTTTNRMWVIRRLGSRTGDSIGPALFQHAEQLTELARFRHHDASTTHLFRHASPRFALTTWSPKR